eukprot:CAMPEP_0197654910 /NCGR_PEP_ID=MMETSP1338-20131121/39132_2 /TAXON_ID=43686 ORGANISM="Pelagodinium beii, Strain RCC1491" /NCGR_SAMPLE_ID=MMETSP1338 /ASSEMBLY_ACC=CAM_ASM_000754 /LENGTH=141 /DNA_ID=CAMNT_0043230445 /DNA_START=137 /DNA_END=561 /DNA_ORIENTATION=-
MQNAERVCSVHTGCLTCHCRQPKEMEAGGTRRPLGQRLAIHCKIQSWTPLSPTLCCTWPVQEDLGGRLRTPDPHTGGGGVTGCSLTPAKSKSALDFSGYSSLIASRTLRVLLPDFNWVKMPVLSKGLASRLASSDGISLKV